MRPTTHDTDVIVIGGGPAGSTAATMLARNGLRVLLLERERFPREHVGESLLPASMPLFEELGAMPAIKQAGFVEKWGAVMVWGTNSEPWSWYFRETNRRYPHAYQVWRAEFDRLLLANSAQHGVDVREGCRALEVCFTHGPEAPVPAASLAAGLSQRDPAERLATALPAEARATGVRYLAEDGGERLARACFVVDASGQTGLLGRALRLRRPDPSFRNLAVYGYFEGVEPLRAPDQGSIFVESFPEGWCWTIPLHTGRASVGVVVDSARAQQSLRREGNDAFFRRRLGQTRHTARRLRDATLVSATRVVRDWSYVSEAVAGDGWVLAGDAACFVDPLFSSGVHLALSAGVLAAAYVTTALRNPHLRETAGRAYQELYYTQYGHFRELAKLFYASNRSVDSYFWEARRILGADESLSPRQAFIEAVAGQPPQGYERVVLQRGIAPAGFAEGVEAVETRRASRRAEAQALCEGGDLMRLVPRLAAGARVERRLVLGEGEFVPGDVLVTSARMEGVPVSPLVARALALVDGRKSVSELLAALSAELGSVPLERLASAVLAALQILYVDGAIAELRRAEAC